MDPMLLGLELMVGGLASVFMVLISFIVLIKILTKVFPYEEKEDRQA